MTKKEFMEMFDKCELCGSPRNLELHHIIPTCTGFIGVDLDVPDNWIMVCHKCHAQLTPKKLLTKIGLQKAKMNGKQLGQTCGHKLTTKKSIAMKEEILKGSKDFNGTLTDKKLLEMTGLSRNTYYKYKRELKAETNHF